MKETLISVIVPVYKVEDYLEDCVKSVADQWQEDIEVILVDDGSPDKCPEICDNLAEKYSFVKSFHKENEGLSAARNYGMDKAEGKYFLFLDSDDTLMPGSLHRIIGKCKENPDFVVGNYKNKNFTTGEIWEDYQLDSAVAEKLQGEELINYLFSLKGYCFYAVLYIVKKEYVEQYKMRFLEGHTYEDSIWTLNLLYNSKKVCVMEEPFYLYLWKRKDSISTDFSPKNYFDKLMSCQNICNFTEKKGFMDSCKKVVNAKANYMYSSLLFEIWNFTKKERKDIWKQLKGMRKILKYSDRHVHNLLYFVSYIIGLAGVGYLLKLRVHLIAR